MPLLGELPVRPGPWSLCTPLTLLGGPGLQSQPVCCDTPLYLLAGSHCFVGSWLAKLFRDLGPLDSSRSVFTKSAGTGPGKSV